MTSKRTVAQSTTINNYNDDNDDDMYEKDKMKPNNDILVMKVP